MIFCLKKFKFSLEPRFLIQNWNFLIKKNNFESKIKKKLLYNERRGFTIGSHLSDDSTKVTFPPYNTLLKIQGLQLPSASDQQNHGEALRIQGLCPAKALRRGHQKVQRDLQRIQQRRFIFSNPFPNP